MPQSPLLLLLATGPLLAVGALPVTDSSSGFAFRALALGERLSTCAFSNASGTFLPEDLWQSGNTIESLSNAVLLARDRGLDDAGRAASWLALFATSFAKTPVIVDQCFDDHQWWLLGWVRAFEASGALPYLQRAAAVFDYIVANGWETAHCGGGVSWCPVSGGNAPYKNAVTSELFFSSAMALHRHASAIVGKPAGFYLAWAAKIWDWFAASGMIGSDGLVNDGLSNACLNNGQTTWTYNQGLALSGLGWLSNATGGTNATLAQAAATLMEATMTRLTNAGGILDEPCSSCDGDQHIFKGVWARHLAYLADALPGASQPAAGVFMARNALSILDTDACSLGGYGLRWEGPCEVQSVACDSAALDALLSAARVGAPVRMDWQAIELGGCVDADGAAMSSCSAAGITEAACRTYAAGDAQAVAYDVRTDCLGITECRVRTHASSCSGSGFIFTAGSATTVTRGDGAALSVCVLRTAV